MKISSKNICEILEEAASLYREDIAIETEHLTYTWKEVNQLSDIIALQMLTSSIPPKSHIGIFSGNSPAWVCTFFAILKIGAIPILLNFHLKERELYDLISYADIQYLYYEDTNTDIRALAMQISDDFNIAISAMENFSGNTLFSPDIRLELQERKSGLSCDDIACMIFTSGSTAIPKGVLLTHRNLVNNAQAMVSSLHWTHEDKLCFNMPMFHCFGITAGIISCTIAGTCMYILDSVKTTAIWNAILYKNCNILNGVPSVFMAMIRNPAFLQYSLDTIKSGIIAGSPIFPEEYMEIMGRFPGMKLQTSYGQTETSPCITMADWDDDIGLKSHDCGRVIDGVDIRIIDKDGKDVSHLHQEGEIQVKGYNIMHGYYKLEEENAKVFTTDGWLKTGDIGKLSETGRLSITGRIKEMIIKSGENISPKEIENVALQIPAVEYAKVIGIPADVIQEEIVLCIILQKDMDISDDEILSYLGRHLARYKLPSRIIRLREFPMNACNKIDLKQLKNDILASVHKS